LQEDKKILYFHPEEVDQNERLKDVGFIEALIKFTGSFSFDTTTSQDVLSMKTSKTLKLFFEPEKDFWIVLVSFLVCFAGYI
jgi:First Longin domain of INTU, CCZ1 and HPS4